MRVSTQKYVSGVKGSSFNKYRRLQGKAGPQPGREAGFVSREATGDLDESGFGGQTEADRGAVRVRKRRWRVSLSSSQCGCSGEVAVTVVGGFVVPLGLDAGDRACRRGRRGGARLGAQGRGT